MAGFLRDELTAEEAALIDSAAAFARDTVKPQAAAWERERRQPVEALRAAAALGLGSLEVPKDAGGPGHRYMVKLAFCEELSRADMGFVFSLVNTHNVAARLAVSPAARHREAHVPALMKAEIFGGTALSEPGAGSDFPRSRRARSKPLAAGSKR